MTPLTKSTRRDEWKSLNFAGTVDWAVDLQSFTDADFNAPPDRTVAADGTSCISGEDLTAESADLCEFSCSLGFCPPGRCTCVSTGALRGLPWQSNFADVIAWDEEDIELNQLCAFACKYGYCPKDVCREPYPDVTIVEVDPAPASPTTAWREANAKGCTIYKDPRWRDLSLAGCKELCKPQLDAAAAEGRTSNYACVGFWDLGKPIPWAPNTHDEYGLRTGGTCSCDNWLLNQFADVLIEALPIIAEVSVNT